MRVHLHARALGLPTCMDTEAQTAPSTAAHLAVGVGSPAHFSISKGSTELFPHQSCQQLALLEDPHLDCWAGTDAARAPAPLPPSLAQAWASKSGESEALSFLRPLGQHSTALLVI